MKFNNRLQEWVPQKCLGQQKFGAEELNYIRELKGLLINHFCSNIQKQKREEKDLVIVCDQQEVL